MVGCSPLFCPRWRFSATLPRPQADVAGFRPGSHGPWSGRHLPTPCPEPGCFLFGLRRSSTKADKSGHFMANRAGKHGNAVTRRPCPRRAGPADRMSAPMLSCWPAPCSALGGQRGKPDPSMLMIPMRLQRRPTRLQAQSPSAIINAHEPDQDGPLEKVFSRSRMRGGERL